MSLHDQFGRLSPPPFYHHSPHTDAAPPTSLSFMLAPAPPPAHRQANPYPSPAAKLCDDTYYVAKYKDMKRKVKEIELDNDRLHLKCLMARKNIQRLRLERAILYERLSTISPADSNISPEVAVQRPCADSYPPPDPVQGQERYQQPPFSPDIQARLHADQSRTRLDLQHQARSQYPQASIPGADPPQRQYEDSAIGYQQPGIPIGGSSCSATKPRQRRLKLDFKDEKSQASPPNTHQEVRNGGSRIFPFVHEYSNTQDQGERPVLAPLEYPSEIRFHQYEASQERRPTNRNRREIDRDTEKGSKLSKRRPPQDMEKDRRRHLHSRSRSPTGQASPHETYAYPIQNVFTSSERDSQQENGDRHHTVTADQHSDESSQRHAAESKGHKTRDGNTAYLLQQEYQAEADRKARDSLRPFPPEKRKKCVQSQVDREGLLARERDERDGCNRGHSGLPRDVTGVEDVYALPRVREGEVMD